MTDLKLNDCLHCGGKAELQWELDGILFKEIRGNTHAYHWVRCSRCGICTIHYRQYRYEAVEDWNRCVNQ